MSRISKSAALALAVGLCAVALVAPAQAKSHQVIGGHTTVAASSAISKLVALPPRARDHRVRNTASETC